MILVPINPTKTSAFTLLELLLVIIILALLATFGLAMYQRNSDSARIDKTALQIQALLQAATAYYVENGCWPNAVPANRSQFCRIRATKFPQLLCNSNTPPPFDNYIPVQLQKNAWGGQYYCQPELTLGKKFQVSMSTGNLPATAQTQLLAKLPNSYIANNFLYSEVAIPPTNAQPGVLIAKISQYASLQNGSTLNPPFSFSCPKNWSGHANAFIQGFHTIGQYKTCQNTPQTMGIGALDPQLDNCPQTDANSNTYTCNGTLLFSTMTGQGPLIANTCYEATAAGDPSGAYFDYLYIGWCSSPTAAKNNTNAPLKIY